MIARGIVGCILSMALAGCASSPLTALQAEVDSKVVSQAPASSVRIVTYNLEHLANSQRLKMDLETIHADIWLFQEFVMPRAADARKIRSLLPDGAWDLVWVRVNRMIGGDESQVIASRWPIRKAEVWPLTDGSGRRRCALVAWVDIGGTEIAVINTDHEPGFFAVGELPQDAQAKHLESWLRETAPTRAVVGGDFNTCGNLWRLRTSHADAALLDSRMQSAGFAPAAQAVEDTYATPLGLSLDHLFVRGVRTQNAGVITSARGSDHYPVFCEIALSGS